MSVHETALAILRERHTEIVRTVRGIEDDVRLYTSRLDWDAEHNPGNIRDREFYTKLLRTRSAQLATLVEARDNLRLSVGVLMQAALDDSKRYPVGQ